MKECLIENAGPIEHLDLTLPFEANGNPKLIIIVGANGSGKSILLSYMVDALFEFAKIAFEDVMKGQAAFTSPYFKLTGSINQRVYSGYNIGLLQFVNGDKKYSYVDKSGNLNYDTYRSKIEGRFEGISWDLEGNIKKHTGGKDDFAPVFSGNSICYFPSSRKEMPHWLNHESLTDGAVFDFEIPIAGVLGKPIFIESCAKENKRWVLDIYLDSLLDYEIKTGSVAVSTASKENIISKFGKNNVELLLKNIFQDNSIKLGIGFRNLRNFRLHIRNENGEIIIPSLDHLSSGQSVLFNLFTTIIRYADKGDVSKTVNLSQIEGIVLIDEIDAHLDSMLQYEILPKIIKLFPKIQFIATTHSPLFLLGMEHTYGSDGIQIIEMPYGMPITSERFSEFGVSLDYYKKTKTYENDIRELISNQEKPLVLAEGKTDPIYIKKALELLNRKDILEKINIDSVGGTGKLDNTKKVIDASPRLLKHKLLLLHDCDTCKSPLDKGLLSVRTLPKNEKNALFTKGIENLLQISPEYMCPEGKAEFNREFYIKHVKDCGEYYVEFNKIKFCNWICKTRANRDDFEGFSVVIDILDKFLESRPSTSEL